jgi:uncharacterized damage-inducible protein DinB
MDKNIYPIGKFEYGKSYTDTDNQQRIQELEQFPKQLISIASTLTPTQLEKSYRPGGWNARQIVHHIADSHMNAYMRVKLSITENSPVIKPYNQDLWANLEDSLKLPIDCSLQLVENIHLRMVYLLRSVDKTALQRNYIHPEYNREFKLDELLALYAWHGKHHAGHLTVIKNLYPAIK